MGGCVKSGEKAEKKVNNGKCEITQRQRGGVRERENKEERGCGTFVITRMLRLSIRASAFSRFVPRWRAFYFDTPHFTIPHSSCFTLPLLLALLSSIHAKTFQGTLKVSKATIISLHQSFFPAMHSIFSAHVHNDIYLVYAQCPILSTFFFIASCLTIVNMKQL